MNRKVHNSRTLEKSLVSFNISLIVSLAIDVSFVPLQDKFKRGFKLLFRSCSRSSSGARRPLETTAGDVISYADDYTTTDGAGGQLRFRPYHGGSLLSSDKRRRTLYRMVSFTERQRMEGGTQSTMKKTSESGPT